MHVHVHVRVRVCVCMCLRVNTMELLSVLRQLHVASLLIVRVHGSMYNASRYISTLVW